MSIRLTLIAVFDEAHLLADEHGIPWKLPRDVAHFRAYTQGKWLLLGRRTFEEMRDWFTDHTPLVLTTQTDYEPSTGHAVTSVAQALALAEAAGQTELVCCGGGQAYATALPHADKLVLTQVHHHFPQGAKPVFFPEFETPEWIETEAQRHVSDAEHAHEFSFITLQR